MQENDIRSVFQSKLNELVQKIWKTNQNDFFKSINIGKRIAEFLLDIEERDGENAVQKQEVLKVGDKEVSLDDDQRKIVQNLRALKDKPQILVNANRNDVDPILRGYKNEQDEKNQLLRVQQGIPNEVPKVGLDINGQPVKFRGRTVPLEEGDYIHYVGTNFPIVLNKNNQRIVYDSVTGERINYAKNANKINNYKWGEPTFASLVLEEEERQLQNSGGNRNAQYPHDTIETLNRLLIDYETKNQEEGNAFKYSSKSEGINPYSNLKSWVIYLKSLEGVDEEGNLLEQGDDSRKIQPVLDYIREKSRNLKPNEKIDEDEMQRQFPMFSRVELQRIRDFQAEWSRVIESLKSTKRSTIPFVIGIGGLLAGLGGVIAGSILMTQTAGYSVTPATPNLDGNMVVPDNLAVQPTIEIAPQQNGLFGRDMAAPGGQTLNPSINPPPTSVDPAAASSTSSSSAAKPNAELGTILLIICAIILAIAIIMLIYNAYKKENEMEDMTPAPKPKLLKAKAPEQINEREVINPIIEEDNQNIVGSIRSDDSIFVNDESLEERLNLTELNDVNSNASYVNNNALNNHNTITFGGNNASRIGTEKNNNAEQQKR